MEPYLSHRSIKILFLFAVITTLVSACDGNGAASSPFPPAAETPVLETILDPDNGFIIAPYHAFGVFEMKPGSRLELRLRAIWPSEIKVKINDQVLPEVKDTSDHPELDSSGYYRISDTSPVSSNDPRYFWRVYVKLPQSVRGNVNYTMTVHNISLNSNLSDAQKEAAPLQIQVYRTPVPVPKPSSVFVDGVPDNKHPRTGPDSALIADNVTLAGWLVDKPFRGLVDPATEDWHYDIWLDNDFIERNYSATTPPIATAVIPGRWYTEADNVLYPKMKIPLTGGKQPDGSTFIMPGAEPLTVELNAWHKSRHTEGNPLGLVPQGWWVNDAELCTFSSCQDQNPDVYWPFPVMEPWNYAGTGPIEPQLDEGDYVIITGELVEDTGHLHDCDAWHWAGNDGGCESQVPVSDTSFWTNKCWDDHYKGQGGWLEIHPVDSIRRVPKDKAPVIRKHAQMLQLCSNNDGKNPILLNYYLTPIPSDPPSDRAVLRYREIIDERFTDMSTVDLHTVGIDQYESAKLRVLISLRPGFSGHFKAIYLLWWEESNEPRPTYVPRPTGPPPPGKESSPTPEDLPVCSKKPYLPQCDNPTLE